MATFLSFIALILVIVFLYKFKRLQARVISLEEKFRTLNEPAKRQAPAPVESVEEPYRMKEIPTEKGRLTIPKKKPWEERPVAIPAPAIVTAAAPSASMGVAASGSLVQAAEQLAKGFIDKELWKMIESKFAENWTGIIGALVMVMGVGFLGVYAALALKPLHRFLMITGFAVFLSILSFYLKSKGKWMNLSVWIQSSAGAILLFAFLGSGWIPGLKWIEDSSVATILLLLGIALNLYLGFIAEKQGFASFHIVVSLIALGIAPQSQMTLILSTVVILFGVTFSYRSRWEHHLLLIILASLIYHYYWYDSMNFLSPRDIPLMLKATGISSVAAIGVTACLLHYRRLYSTREFDLLPSMAHMANWVYLVVGFLLYSTGSKWNMPVLSGAADWKKIAQPLPCMLCPYYFLESPGAVIPSSKGRRNFSAGQAFTYSQPI